MEIVKSNFVGYSDGIPDLHASHYSENGVDFLEFCENMETATLALDKESVSWLRRVLDRCEAGWGE